MPDLEMGLLPEARLRILYTGDLHGNVEKMKYISTVIKQLREESRNRLLLDSGDWSKGNPICDRFAGAPMAEIMEYLKYDAACLGEQDLAWGIRGLKKLAKIVSFPLLCSNLEGKLPEGIKPFIIKEISGLKIAIVGVTSVVQLKERQYSMLSPEESIKKALLELKEQEFNFLILLSHMGIDKDKELAGLFPEIDVIIGGHSHIRLDEPLRMGTTLIAHSGAYGDYLGSLDVDLGSVLTIREKEAN